MDDQNSIAFGKFGVGLGGSEYAEYFVPTVLLLELLQRRACCLRYTASWL
jgi:hypothetical protein